MTEKGYALPPRPTDGHKGTFGSVCVIGGQQSEDGVVMLGAPALAANAAMRTGCGNAILAMPQSVLQSGLQLAPSSTGIALPIDEVGRVMPSPSMELLDAHASGCSCFALGTGFGCGWSQQQLVSTLLSREEKPIVLDADGLNALAQLEGGQLDIHAPVIMTPHIGEYQRLAQRQGIEVEASQVEDAAIALAQAYGCVVVLKSHITVITNGVTTEVETTGQVVLATGGSGDVLTGIISGLLAQYRAGGCKAGLLEAAVLGVRVHAQAGNLFAKAHGTCGMLATDLLENIPDAISSMRSN